MISRRFALEGGWVVAGQISSVLGLLASLRVLTETLPPKAFGEFTLGLTLAFFASQIIFGPIINGIVRYYSIASQASQTTEYFLACRALLRRAVTLTAVIGLLMAVAFWVLDHQHWTLIILAATALAMASGYSGALGNMLTAARQRAWVACQQGLEPWIKLLCALVASLLLGKTGASPLIGYALGHTLSGLLLHAIARRMMRDVPPSPPGNWRSQIWEYARPFLLFGIFTWANISSDRWALQHFAGPQEVGLYSTAFMLGYSPMVTLSTVLVQLALPIIYQSSSPTPSSTDPNWAWSRAKRQCDLLAGAIVLVTALAWSIAYWSHERIFAIFIAHDYRSASVLMPWMVLAGGFFSAGEAAALFLNSSMRSHMQIMPKIITALIGVVLNMLGAWLFGSEGVVFSVLTFSILYFSWLRYIVWRTTRPSPSPPSLGST